MNPSRSPASRNPVQEDRQSARGDAPKFCLAPCAHEGVAFCGVAAHGIGVRVASATSTDEAPLEEQSKFASSSASRSRMPVLFAEVCNIGVAECIPTNR